MKKTLTILLLIAFGYCIPAHSQNQADVLKKQAEENLAKENNVRARYFYLQAYYSYASQADYEQAVACGIQVAELYWRDNLFQEAFELLYRVDQLLTDGERKTEKTMPALRFGINKERWQIYITLKNAPRAQYQLGRMEDLAKAAASDSLNTDLLYAQATYYYMFGQSAEGDRAINKLIEKHKERQEYDKVSDCYKNMISIARRGNNAALVARMYDNYMLWNDSVDVMTARTELDSLQMKYDGSLAIIQEKEDSLSIKQYIIIGLCVLVAILVAALVVGAIVLLRYILITRRQKKNIALADEHSNLQAQFIRNISGQMKPTLDTLDQSDPGVQALHTFSRHIQELSELENSLSESYRVEERNISTFCENVMDKVRSKVREDVSLAVNTPKMNVKISPEQLERVLLHLLENAAEHTPAGGKIWLDFKKRGGHTHQFIVSDTGCGIEASKRENLFKPFTEVKLLTEGDGLGLPICALMAIKMNGSLTLDETYTKGARFVLELHT